MGQLCGHCGADIEDTPYLSVKDPCPLCGMVTDGYEDNEEEEELEEIRYETY